MEKKRLESLAHGHKPTLAPIAQTSRSLMRAIASTFAIAIACTAGAYAQSPQPANVFVDFTAPGAPTSALSVGSTVSTYADSGTNLIKGAQQATWQRYASDLGPIVWRIPLFYHDGQVGSSANYARGGNDGEAYIRTIKAIGGTPMIAVGGTTSDNDIQATDAAALVHYFNDNGGQHGGPIDAYIIGNEPDNGFGLDPYLYGGKGSSGFHAIVTAMRGATSRPLTIAGPALNAWASYKYGDFQKFFAAASSDADTVDFHKYGDGQPIDNVNLTGEYEDGVNWVQQQVANTFGYRAGQVAVQVGEFNYNPSYGALWRDTFYTSRNVVHTASVIGHVLRAGGRAYQYSDNNGPLGLITDGTGRNDQPAGQFVRMPAYWGITAWTGGAWTRRYGAVMVSASTNLPDFEVFATDNAKKIILINRSPDTDRHAVLALTGKPDGTYSTWQYARGMDPADFAAGPQFQPPSQRAANAPFSGGHIEVDVPWMSVAVLTVD